MWVVWENFDNRLLVGVEIKILNLDDKVLSKLKYCYILSLNQEPCSLIS